MAQLRAVVDAPQARPPAYGLIAAAPIIDAGDLRWAGGWEFQPEGCTPGGADSIACAGNVGAMTPADRASTINGDPILLYASDECSTFGFEAHDFEGRARRALAATESYQLALELWEGAVNTADGLSNKVLAGPAAGSDTVTSGAVDPVIALACVESGLASALYGGQGMIHMTPQMLTLMAADDAIMKQGNLWVTANGHIVVADAGYTGSGPVSVGPTTSSQWIYGTPVLSVRLGPVETIPGSLDEARNLAAAMDRTINDILVFAARLAGVVWPNECAHVAAEVNKGICLIGGAS